MIPLPLQPYVVVIRLLLIVLACVVVFATGWKAGASHWRERWQSDRAAVAREHAQAVDRAREAERASYAKSQEVSRDYQQQLAAIRADRDRLRARPVPVVRLCVDPAGGMPAAGPATGGPDAATAGATEAPGSAGLDLGPALYGVADDGDEREASLNAQLRKLQGYVAEVCPAAPAGGEP